MEQNNMDIVKTYSGSQEAIESIQQFLADNRRYSIKQIVADNNDAYSLLVVYSEDQYKLRDRLDNIYTSI